MPSTRIPPRPIPTPLRPPDPLAGAPNPCPLLVIAPQDFVTQGRLTRFLAHKNASGMPAHLVSLEAVPGPLAARPPQDHPWLIKQLIARAHEQLGTRYVLLAGDASLIPVRHRFVAQADGGAAIGFTGTFNPTDHYYANLYRPGGRAAGLSDWDADRDGRYNETVWDQSPQAVDPDGVDGYPHVAVGRIPAASGFECELYADKVVAYEQGRTRRRRPRYAFLADHTLDGAAARQRCDAAIAFSGLDRRPGIGGVHRCEWAPDGVPLPPAPWYDFSTVGQRLTVLTSDWLVHLGHGHPGGWDVRADRPIDRAYVEGQGSDSDGGLVRNSHYLPIILSAGCDTGQLMTNAPIHPYRGLSPDRKRWLWFDAQRRQIEDRLMPEARFDRWPIEAPLPHPYDDRGLALDAGGRNFAASWLCRTPHGGAIAYVGATVVHQGGAYSMALFERMLRAPAAGRTLGDLWLQGCRDYHRENLFADHILGNRRILLGIQTLYGDPSLRLAAA